MVWRSDEWKGCCEARKAHCKHDVAGFGIGNGRGGRGIFAVQSLDLIGIENRVSFQKRNGALVVRLGVLHDKLVSIDNGGPLAARSEEHTSELQSLMRISYAVFCLKKKHMPTSSRKTNYLHAFTLITIKT